MIANIFGSLIRGLFLSGMFVIIYMATICPGDLDRKVELDDEEKDEVSITYKQAVIVLCIALFIGYLLF